MYSACFWRAPSGRGTASPLYRLFSLFPVSAALVLGVLGGPLRALAPRLSFFADAVTEKGTLTPLNAWTLKRWLPFLLLCAVLFACALELYLALGHGAAAYAGVAVYLSGFASYGAMGFSPSIWASGARSGFFFAFALGGRGRAGAARAAGETDAVAGVRLYGSRVRAGAMSLAPRGIGLFLGGGTTDF